MKFKIQQKQPHVTPTQNEEQLKAEVMKLCQSEKFKNTSDLVKEIDYLLRYKRMNNSHIAYLTGPDLTISVKRIFKQQTIFEIVKI